MYDLKSLFKLSFLYLFVVYVGQNLSYGVFYFPYDKITYKWLVLGETLLTKQDFYIYQDVHLGSLYQTIIYLNLWCTTLIISKWLVTDPFRRFSTHVWQNARVNNIRRVMVYDEYFFYVKFYNFIKGIVCMYKVFFKKLISFF